MIIGLGSDLIDIRRIERTLERFGDRFVQRVFTPLEREQSDRRANRAHSYARRYAAKEAMAKALGTGFRAGVFWRDIGVVNLPGGKPSAGADRRGRGAAGGDHAAGHPGPCRRQPDRRAARWRRRS